MANRYKELLYTVGSRSMKRLSGALIAAVSAVNFTHAAFAADLPRKAPAVPPPPAFSWTGFYIGGYYGTAIGNQNGSTPTAAPGSHPGQMNVNIRGHGWPIGRLQLAVCSALAGRPGRRLRLSRHQAYELRIQRQHAGRPQDRLVRHRACPLWLCNRPILALRHWRRRIRAQPG